MTLAVVSEEVVETLFQWASRGVEHPHAPFANTRCGISRVMQNLRDRYRFLWQGKLTFAFGNFPISPYGAMSAMQAGHERRAAGRAHARATVGLRVARAFAGHAVQIWCLDQFLPIAAKVPLGEVVAENENDVGFCFVCLGVNSHKREAQE